MKCRDVIKSAARIVSLVAAIIICSSFASYGQKTYVVCVGLNVYDNGENPLPCSAGDVKGIANFFNKYNGSEVFMLLDKNATRAHIIQVLKQQFAKAGPEDEIIFAYSGHGFDGGVSCYDTKNRVYCSEVQEIMRNSNAGRKVIFMNACHSGSFSKKYTTNPTQRNRGDYKKSKADVMLFMSSRDNESSWERTDMTYSYFFNRLIGGLKGNADVNNDKNVTARELFNYVYGNVLKDTNNKQHPQMYGNFDNNMVVVTCK